MEVCREISLLRQEWRDSHGRLTLDIPEELFIKFLAYAGSLSDCVQGWPIQLCSTYFTALSSTISDRMMLSDDYTSPLSIGLNDKNPN